MWCLLSCAMLGAQRIVVPSGYKVVDTEGRSALYEVQTSNGVYTSGPVQLLDLHGTRSEQGFAFGRMGGRAALENYEALTGALIDTKSVVGKLEVAALEVILDWQWTHVLSKQVPSTMSDEIAGFGQGCKKAMPQKGHFCEHGAGRIVLLGNMPGTVSDIVYVLLDELPKPVVQAATALLGGTSLEAFLRSLPWPPAQCSMWAAWGARTDGGRVFSGRNLDWNENTGINRHKLITVHHPPEAGLVPHAAFGFGGLLGALAGLSAAGLTVHEANLESNLDSFKGFPWLLRMRYVMEHSESLEAAKAVMLSTKNTVGFNHMVASAKDRSAYVFETNAKSTAVFGDNDPREAAAAFVGPGRTIRGAPLSEAVWRTNHGFDQRIVSHYMWNHTQAYNDSDTRYHLIQSALVTAATDTHGPVTMNASVAVGLTALVGQKGPDYAACSPPFKGGSNVLSVAFDPTALTAYAAWEDGAGFGTSPGNWRPAACNAYLQLDLATWFAKNGTKD